MGDVKAAGGTTTSSSKPAGSGGSAASSSSASSSSASAASAASAHSSSMRVPAALAVASPNPDLPKFVDPAKVDAGALAVCFASNHVTGGKKIPKNTKFATPQGLVVVNTPVECNLRVVRMNASRKHGGSPQIFTEGVIGDYNIDNNELLFVSHKRSTNATSREVEIQPSGQGMPYGVYSCFNGMTGDEYPVCIGFSTTNHVSSGPDVHGDRGIAMAIAGVFTTYSGPEPIHIGDTLWWDFPHLRSAPSAIHKKIVDKTAEDYLMQSYVESKGPTKILPVLRPYRPSQHGLTNVTYNIKKYMADWKAAEAKDTKDAGGVPTVGAAAAALMQEYDSGKCSLSPCEEVHRGLLPLVRAMIAVGSLNAGQLTTYSALIEKHYAFLKSRVVAKALNSCNANSAGLTVMFGVSQNL